MLENTDTLKEACKIAGIVAGEEQSIVDLEKQIANRFREITKKIFSENKFRMKKIPVIADETIDTVYAGIIAIYEEGIVWGNNGFHGTSKSIRITPSGTILRLTEYLGECRSFDLHTRDEIYLTPYETVHRPANDHEIATVACDLARELLAALKIRIDTSKTEKDELRRIAGKL